MVNLKITDVRALSGDSAFLIDDGKTAILCDTGFAFTGDTITANIKKELGERPLDYIFLTHSHYDHALGSAYVAKYYPNVKIVAGEYAEKIFAKPSARAKMRELDRKFAEECGVSDYEDLIDNLRVDICVKDGDIINAGDMQFKVINLPGHTKCSVGYYLSGNKLLLAPETLGAYFDDEDIILPLYLAGYKMTLDSIEKAKTLDIENILVPHYGLLNKEQTKTFFIKTKTVAMETAEKIAEILNTGGTVSDAMKYFADVFYIGSVRIAYPEDAFKLNTSIMIDLISKELCNK